MQLSAKSGRFAERIHFRGLRGLENMALRLLSHYWMLLLSSFQEALNCITFDIHQA